MFGPAMGTSYIPGIDLEFFKKIVKVTDFGKRMTLAVRHNNGLGLFR